MRCRSFLTTLAAAAGVTVAGLPSRAYPQEAAPIAFDAISRTVTFPRRTPTRFGLGGMRLAIEGDASASLIYRAVPEAARGARRAAWNWTVSESVPPTDLSRRGGDDRNISVYFVFMDAAAAAGLSPDTSPQRLLSSRSARSLLYVWGGAHPAGAMLPSPYLRGRGMTVALRPAGTGAARAEVDLVRDHAAAFGAPPELLVGLAVSADSDDTNSRLRASLSDLILS